jgi:hypothetical protein
MRELLREIELKAAGARTISGARGEIFVALNTRALHDIGSLVRASFDLFTEAGG